MKNAIVSMVVICTIITASVISRSLAGTDYLMPLAQCNTCNEKWYMSQDDEIHGYSKESAYDFTLPGNNDLGKPVLAIADGKVVMTTIDPSSFTEHNEPLPKGYGYFIVIEHNNGTFSRYAHLQSLSHLKLGDNVKAGEIIGRLGASGASINGAHLHFGMWSGTLQNKTKFIPPQLGQYTALTKLDSNGNMSYYYPETEVYDPHGQLSTEEKQMYAYKELVIQPTSYISVTPTTDILFTPSGQHYFKAPHTVTQLAQEYGSGAMFGPIKNYNVLDSKSIIEFTDPAAVGPQSGTVEYNPLAAKQVASAVLVDEITASGLSGTDIVEGLAKLNVIEKSLSAQGESLNNTLQKILGDSELSLLKRFAGGLGSDVSYSHILEAIGSVRDSINIPTAITKALEENTTASAAYQQTLNREAQTVIQKLQNAITSSGGVAATIGIALLLVMVGYFQKPKREAEENLKNIFSSAVASSVISKYWNLVPLATQNWLKNMGTQKDPDGNIRESIENHKRILETEKQKLLEKAKLAGGLSVSEEKEFAKVHNALALLDRIHKNIIPAKVNGESDSDLYESDDIVPISGFTDKMQELFQSTVGIFGSSIVKLYPRVKGVISGVSSVSPLFPREGNANVESGGEFIQQKGETNTDAPSTTTNAQAGSSAISIAQVTTLNNQSASSTVNSAADVINHWAKQYIVVGVGGVNGFIAADGKVYTDVNKAWEVTRGYVSSGKQPIPFFVSAVSTAEASRINKAYENGTLSINLNHLPERNPAKGWTGNIAPLPTSYTSVVPSFLREGYPNISEGGVSSSTQGGGISYDFWQNMLASYGRYGITPISYSTHYGRARFEPSKDYPEGNNTAELRKAAEAKVNKVLNSIDPYDIVHPKWESYKVISASNVGGIEFNRNNVTIGEVERAMEINLIKKLQGAPVVRVPYVLNDNVKVNNTSLANNAGIQVIKLQVLPADIATLQESELKRIAQGLSISTYGKILNAFSPKNHTGHTAGFATVFDAIRDHIAQEDKIKKEAERVAMQKQLENTIATALQNYKAVEVSKGKFLLPDGSVFVGKADEAGNLAYIMKMSKATPVRYYSFGKNMTTDEMNVMENGMKTIAPTLSATVKKLANYSELSTKLRVVNGVAIDAYGIKHKTVADAIKTLQDSVVINGQIISGVREIQHFYGETKDLLMKLEGQINEVIRNYGVASNPLGSGYYAPDGKLYSLEKAKQIALVYKATGMRVSGVSVLNATQIANWKKFEPQIRQQLGIVVKFDVRSVGLDDVPPDIRQVFEQHAKEIGYVDGWFKNKYYRRSFGGHMDLFQSVREQVRADALMVRR